MHNLRENPKDIDEAFERTKFKLHSDKKAFCIDNETEIKQAHTDYDTKANAGNLKDLKTIWDTKADADKIEKAKGLYGSSRNIIIEHWNKLKELNGDADGELICPMCGIEVADEMDHFAPKSVFPEYATHLTNLIPLCHRCNSDKSDLWLDSKNRQIFFNAYFDKIKFEELFEVVVKYSKTSKAFKAEVIFSGKFEPDKKTEHFRVKASVEKLKLWKYFNREVGRDLRKVINELISEYSVNQTSYSDPIYFIRKNAKEWKDQLVRDNFDTVMEKMLYQQLADNTTIHDDLAAYVAANL